MSKLTNRSQLTLKKIKAQYGDFINDSMYYLQKQKPELFSQENQQVQEEGSFLDALPVIGSIGQVIGGIAGIFEGAKKRKKQRIYENAYREDLQDKREKSRANNFYLTPYTAGRTDDLTAKKGMKVPLYQDGGQTDLNSFMEFYNQQEQAKQRQTVWLNSLYKDQNEQLKANAKQTTNQGINDIGGGLMGLAGSIFQQGGTIKTKYEDRQVTPAKINYGVSPIPAAQVRAIDSGGESVNSLFRNFGKGNNKSKSKPRFREKQEGGEIEQPDTENLYSPDFNLDLNQVEEQVTNTLKAESPGESMLDNSNLMKWLFEEEPLQTHTVSDIYDQQYSNIEYVGGESKPIQPVVDKLISMGLKPSSVDTGVHNPGSKHYHGSAVDLGLNTSFGGDQKKMDTFLQYLNSPEGKKQFPNIKVRDERTRPTGQQEWSGSHLHLEIN